MANDPIRKSLTEKSSKGHIYHHFCWTYTSTALHKTWTNFLLHTIWQAGRLQKHFRKCTVGNLDFFLVNEKISRTLKNRDRGSNPIDGFSLIFFKVYKKRILLEIYNHNVWKSVLVIYLFKKGLSITYVIIFWGVLTHIYSQSYHHHVLAYHMHIHSWWQNM